MYFPPKRFGLGIRRSVVNRDHEPPTLLADGGQSMRRCLVAASIIGAVLLAGLVILLRPGPSTAKPDKDQPDALVPRPGSVLPIGNIILYSSGVGYFQREGKVVGNARV